MKLTIFFLTSILILNWIPELNAAPGNTCQGNNIRKIFPSGALWELCWTIKDKEGLYLSQVHFKAPNSQYRRILGEASLSQIQTDFDDGTTNPIFISTQMGLGGDNAQALNQQACHNGKLHAENGRSVLCVRTLSKGYQHKHHTQRQTEAFELSSYSQVDQRNYQLRWTFYENGTIEPTIGLSGAVTTGFTDHYLWRLDFDIGAIHDDDSVQEVNSKPSQNRQKKHKTINNLQTETARKLNPENKTFWSVIDSNTSHQGLGPVSYEIVPSHYDQSGANSLAQSWLNNDIYFTSYNRCERHMANNVTLGCSNNVTGFINNNQNIARADVVAWYKQSNHYLPRSEDSNRIATRWSSFKLFPRDWNTKNTY